MRDIFKIFTIGASVFLLLAVGVVAYINHNSIIALRGEISALRAQSLYKADNPVNPGNFTGAMSGTTTTPKLGQSIWPRESLKSLVLRKNDLWGEIKEIKGQTIVVEARIADISKIDQFDELKIESLRTIIKRFNVLTNQETVFTSRKFSELKVGDSVRAFSKSPIYGSEEFTATYVSYLAEEDLSILKARGDNSI